DSVVGGPRYLNSRTINSGSLLYEIDVQDLSALRASVLAEMIGVRSEAKFVPDFVWSGASEVKRVFLQSLFEGDGSCSALARDTIQISYSTRSARLAADVQQLLLEFGVVARLCRYADGELKLVISNRRDARTFATVVGFLGAKQAKLESILLQL